MTALSLCMAALFGLIFGSFWNVVIYRLPRMLEQEWQEEMRRHEHELSDATSDYTPEPALSLSLPRSHCPHCLASIRLRDLVPVVSWLFLRGRCHNCQASISVRYPLVELINAGLALLATIIFGLHWEALAAYGVLSTLLACALIDHDSQWLPDNLTLSLLWAGLLVASLGVSPTGLSLHNAAWGSMFGYLSLWLMATGFKFFTGKDGLGGGDVKLLAALGAWLGALALPGILLGSSLLGLCSALWYRYRYGIQGAFPFGPSLAAAGALAFCHQINLF